MKNIRNTANGDDDDDDDAFFRLFVSFGAFSSMETLLLMMIRLGVILSICIDLYLFQIQARMPNRWFCC